MRPFETLSLILATLSVLPILFAQRGGQRRLRWLSLASLVALAAHLWVEGSRWQMLPTYALVAGAALLLAVSLLRPALQKPTLLVRLGAGTLFFLWLIVAIALPVLFPVPHPLAPTGPFGVGTRTYYLVDENRRETYSDDVAFRELMVQLWYPATIDEGDELAPFIEGIDIAGPAIARRLGLPDFLLGHIDLASTSAYRDARPAGGGPFPLLVFSHGLRGLRVQNTSLMQELASHGYVVAAIDHTYANVLTLFPDGRVAFFNQQTVMPEGTSVAQSGARLVGVWVGDIRFVVQQLETWSGTPGHPLQGQIDSQLLGLLGHSTGGGAAIQGCAVLASCDAALVLDGWIEPVEPDIRDAPYRQALMLISSPDWLGANNRALGERLYAQNQDQDYLLTVAGTVHFDFTDIPLMSPVTPLIGLSGDIDGPRMVRIINLYSVAFFDSVLKEQPSALLDGASEEFPEVRFGQ
jgi:hypothetical protein